MHLSNGLVSQIVHSEQPLYYYLYAYPAQPPSTQSSSWLFYNPIILFELIPPIRSEHATAIPYNV